MITDGGIGISNLERDIGSSIVSQDLDINYKSEETNSEKDVYYQKELQADNYI